MGKEETLTVLNLQAENDRLTKRIFFLERENRELNKEISEFSEREKQLLQEINSLEFELEEANRGKLPKIFQQPSETVEDFLSPKVNTGTGLDRSGKGLEEYWEDFMYAYTDEIFIDSDKPDVLFYKDESDKCYTTPTGGTRLPFPILKEDLERYNILKVRPLTEEELTEVCKEYNLL